MSSISFCGRGDGDGPESPEPPRARRSLATFSGATDEELWSAARYGSTRAQRALFERFSTLVRGLLRRSLGSQRDVEDHVQEVFLRFFRDLPNVRNPEAVRSFIVGITVRVARNEVRQRAIRNRLTPWLERWPTLQQGSAHEIANSSGGARQPFDSIDGYCLDSLDWNDHEPVWRLQAILEQLGPQPRLVFVLRYVRQLELTDVAAALGLSLSTVKRQLKRANRQVYALAKSDPLLAKYIPRQDDD